MKFPQKKYEEFAITPELDWEECARWGFEQAKKLMLAKIKEDAEALREPYSTSDKEGTTFKYLGGRLAGYEALIEWLEGELK